MKDFLSAHLLRAAVARWFARNHPGRAVWFAETTLGPCPPPLAERIDVVLMGNFCFEALRMRFWPRRQYRFWVLCEAARQVLVEQLRLKPEWVNVIPRYELFPARAPRALPAPCEPFTLAYAGRITRAKNVLLLARVVSELQLTHGWDARLLLLGEFDGYGLEDAGLWDIDDKRYRAAFLRGIGSLSWKHKPRIVSGLGNPEWLRRLPPRTVGISLSRHGKEDFGVAVAQFQRRGLPVVASRWGAHRDLRDVLHVPVGLIAHPASDVSTMRKSARLIADYLSQNWSLPSVPVPASRTPAAIYASKEQALARLELLKKNFPPILDFTFQRKWFDYCGSRQGQRFMSGYRRSFAGGSF